MFDLAAIYIVLVLKQQPDNIWNVVKLFGDALDNGYTYTILKSDIMNAFKYHRDVNFGKYKKPMQDGNLLKCGVRYYHKELNLMSKLPAINHDIDNGTLTSSKVEYYLEPVASYTIDDVLKYFYSKNMADTTEYNYKRMYGMFKFKIDAYGLEKVLFMIEAAARMYESEHKIFTLNDFDTYNTTASQYLEEIKNNCKYSGGEEYVIRKRVLPC